MKTVPPVCRNGSRTMLRTCTRALCLTSISALTPQTQARAGRFLRGEKRLKNATLDRIFHARTGVGAGHAHAALSSSPVVRRADIEQNSTAGRHGIDRVADQVGEHLAQLPAQAEHLRGGLAKAPLHRDLRRVDLALVEHQHGLQQLRQADHHRQRGLFVKTQRLLRNLRHAGDLVLRHLRVLFGFVIQRVVVPQQVEQVRHAFQGIVDLMRDGCRQPARGRKLFPCAAGPAPSACVPWSH